MHFVQTGGIRIFTIIKTTIVCAGAYLYCKLSVKTNMCKTQHGARRSWTHLFCICFCMCGQQNLNAPNLSPMADNVITRGTIRGLGWARGGHFQNSPVRWLKAYSLMLNRGRSQNFQNLNFLHIFVALL